MVKQTSLDAFLSVKINKRESEVLEVIKNHPGLCNKEIAKVLGWEINRVTGRVKGLRDKGKVRQLGEKEYDGRSVMTWEMEDG